MNKIEKAWSDLYGAGIEPRVPLPIQICIALLTGLGAGLLAGMLFFLN
jgi:hypothetical protein